MKKFKIALACLAVTALTIGVTTFLPVQSRPQPAQASEPVPFDHSNCQYPDRWTNPVDGCDNSDPAVPECIKAASTQQSEQDCIAAFVKQHEQPSEPATTTPASNINPNQCGVK